MRARASDALMIVLYLLLGSAAIGVLIDPSPSLPSEFNTSDSWIDDALRIVGASTVLGCVLGLLSRLWGSLSSESTALFSLASGCVLRALVDLHVYGWSYLAGWWVAGALGLSILALDRPDRFTAQLLVRLVKEAGDAD